MKPTPSHRAIRLRLPRRYALQQRQVGVFRDFKLRIVPLDDVVGEQFDPVVVAAGGKELEGADPHMACRDAHEHRPLLHRFAIDLLAGRDRRQGPRRRHAERVHRLGHDVFAQHRSQRRTPVTSTGKRRRAGALQLDVAACSLAVDDLAQQDRPSVAELRHEIAELVAGIGHGDRHGAGRHDIAGQDRRQPAGIGKIGLDAQFRRQRRVEFQELRPLHRLGIDGGEKPVRQAGIGIVELEHGKNSFGRPAEDAAALFPNMGNHTRRTSGMRFCCAAQGLVSRTPKPRIKVSSAPAAAVP